MANEPDKNPVGGGGGRRRQRESKSLPSHEFEHLLEKTLPPESYVMMVIPFKCSTLTEPERVAEGRGQAQRPLDAPLTLGPSGAVLGLWPWQRTAIIVRPQLRGLLPSRLDTLAWFYGSPICRKARSKSHESDTFE